LRQKNRDARWPVKFSKARPKDAGEPQIDIAVPVVGHKSHVSIDGIIRRHQTGDAAAHDGARLREGLIDPANTASHVWAATAYRSAANDAYLSIAGRSTAPSRGAHEERPRRRDDPRLQTTRHHHAVRGAQMIRFLIAIKNAVPKKAVH
jgi:hypothetical protein